MIRRVRAAGHADGCELGIALETVALALRHGDGRTGSLGEIRDAAEMVEMAVRDQDGRAARPHPRELEPQLGRVAAGVDDRRVARAAVGANDVAVGLERSQRIPVDDDGHAGESNERYV